MVLKLYNYSYLLNLLINLNQILHDNLGNDKTKRNFKFL